MCSPGAWATQTTARQVSTAVVATSSPMPSPRSTSARPSFPPGIRSSAFWRQVRLQALGRHPDWRLCRSWRPPARDAVHHRADRAGPDGAVTDAVLRLDWCRCGLDRDRLPPLAGPGAGSNGANASSSPLEKCVRMASERVRLMYKGSNWTLRTTEAAGETALAAHGFLRTWRNASARNIPRVHPGNVVS